MAAGADSIDDMALLRHGGMGKVFTAADAPSTLGSFLRAFTLGRVRQVDAVASRVLVNLARDTSLLGARGAAGTVAWICRDSSLSVLEMHGTRSWDRRCRLMRHRLGYVHRRGQLCRTLRVSCAPSRGL